VPLGYTTPLTSPIYPKPPYNYENAKLFLALFYAPEESLRKVLPPPLRPSDMNLMGLMCGQQPCKETGTFMESGVLAQCLFKNPDTKEDEVGVHFCHNYVDTDVAMAAGREIWGYPRKMAAISMDWKGDTLVAKTVRDGVTLLKATCTFTDDGEWIDSGPNVNVKVIPSVTGKGYDLASITAAYLKYTIKKGRSGEVQVELKSGPRDDLSMVKIESTMIGLYFDTDIFLPAGKAVGKVKLG